MNTPQEIEKILKRHMARTLTALDQISVADIIKDEIKKEYHYAMDDIYDFCRVRGENV